MVENGLAESDIVFYGQVIKSDTIKGTYTFRIIELFKGRYASKTINGKASGGNCSVLPKLNDFWIVYSNINDDKTIDLSMCSPSQSIYYDVGYYPPPPPPPINDNRSHEVKELENQIYKLENQNNCLSNWIYQLEKLKQYKLSHNSVTKESKSDFKDKIIIGSLILNGLLLLTIIFAIVSKKKANNRITK